MAGRLETIAIIPARGGSKGIRSKNIVDLAGKPLIAYSILAARHAKNVDRVVVSTEDEEIAKVAREWGAEVPFLRPKEFAQDNSSVGDAISYTLTHLHCNGGLKGYVQLYPTSPFRTPKFIDKMLNILYQGYRSLYTVKEITVDRHLLYLKDQSSGQLINLFGDNEGIPVWKKYYRAYSVLIACSMQPGDKHYYHILTNKCMLIDIDTPQDLIWAEAIIENNLFDFGF